MPTLPSSTTFVSPSYMASVLRFLVSNLIGRSSTTFLPSTRVSATTCSAYGWALRSDETRSRARRTTPASAIALRTVVAVVVTSCRLPSARKVRWCGVRMSRVMPPRLIRRLRDAET